MDKKIIFSYFVSALAIIIAVLGFSVKNVEKKAESDYIEFKVEGKYLQWRNDTSGDWQNLYDLTMLAGADGKDGIDGKDGADGKDGIDGKDGADGKDGIDGKDGVDGKDGIDGKDGADGKDGIDGKDGVDGKDGIDGINGVNGKDGREVEFTVINKVLYWRYIGDSQWIKLFSLDEYLGGGSNDDEEPAVPEISPLITSVNGSTTDFGCIANKTICEPGTMVTVKVNASEVRTFYVIKDDIETNKLTLISDSNIGNDDINTVPWNKKDPNNYQEAGDTSLGPMTILTNLNYLTTSWTNIGAMNYNYTTANISGAFTDIVFNNGVVTITHADGVTTSVVPGVANARLLTYEEAKGLGCTTISGSCPEWLAANLDGIENSLRPGGYWLLSANSNKNAYVIRDERSATNSTVFATNRGIRPVITISKYGD